MPDDARQHAHADLADLQTLSLLAAQETQQRDQRERFAALLRDIAVVAAGDDGPRQGVEAALAQMEAAGWMLGGPVARIWAGERERDTLVAGLDAQDTLLVERVLELVGQYERVEPQPDRPRTDIDQVIQNFLPLLGDIALAAFGDATAQQLAEAVLPQLEESGWQLEQAARRLWAGERDAAALTEAIDPNSAALVRRTLRMVEDGPGMIFVAQSMQLAQSRRRAEQITAQARASGDAAQRAEVARQLEEAAAQAEQQPGAPWQALAMQLRGLAAQLGEV